jgi:hypothetical protein
VTLVVTVAGVMDVEWVTSGAGLPYAAVDVDLGSADVLEVVGPTAVEAGGTETSVPFASADAVAFVFSVEGVGPVASGVNFMKLFRPEFTDKTLKGSIVSA